MIEKITNQNQIARHKLAEKINELIYVVNEFEKDREEIKAWIAIVSDLRSRVPVVESRVSILEEHAHPTATTKPADPYAEQRKWIGKVCWFWDDDNTNSSCGILTSIDTETFKEPQFVCNDEYDYEHCEPVKPDDDIIYKGE